MEGTDATPQQPQDPKPTPGINNRRAPRVPKRIEVALQFPDHEQRYYTRDISYLGIFIECPEPLPLRKLVRFKAHLEVEQAPVQMLGLVAHRVNSADAMESGRPAGMGIQLYPVGHEVRSNWRHFVRQEYEKDPEAREQIRQQEYPRVKVRFPTPNDIQIFASEHVSSGDVFIRTADLYQQGARVWLEAIHPLTKESCSVEAIVLEFVESPRQRRGMRLMFPEAVEASQTLLDFLREQAGGQ